MIMSIYEQVKALNKKEQKQMLRFTRSSLRRNRRKAKDQYEQEQELEREQKCQM